MAIIQSYPINFNVKGSDLLLGVTNIATTGAPVYQTKSFRLSDIMGGGGGTVEWGGIDGDINNQTDLIDELDAKQDSLVGTGLVKSTAGTISYVTDGSTNWNSAYNDSITSIAVTGTDTKLLTMNRRSGSPLTATWAGGGGSIGIGSPANGLSIVDDLLYVALSGASSIGVLSSTDWNTFNNKQTALTFSTPLVNTSNTVSMPPATGSANGYLTSASWTTFNNKQAALSGSGIVKSTAGTISYLSDNSDNWNTAYSNSIVSAAVTGTTTKTLSLNQQDGGSITASWTDDGGGVSSFNTRTGDVTLSSSDVTTALGYTPVTNARTITINGTTQSLANNQTWVVTAVETDTLASVTGRGASTSTLSTFNFGVNTVSQTNSQPGITNTMTSGSNGGRGAVFYGSTGLSYGSRSMEVYSSNYGAGIKFIVASTGYEQSNNAMWFFYQNTQVGSVSCTDTATTYATSSDYRLKENIQPVINSLDRVDLLKPCRFNFIVNPNKVVDGFIAHEVQEVVPEAVTGVKDEVDPEGTPMYQGIDQAKLVPLLTAAIQELHAKVKELELLIKQ